MPSPTPKSRKSGAGCPICARPPSGAHGPFCGQGCRDRDLLNWLGDAYRVPGPPADDEGKEIDADGLDIAPDRPL
jgi:endogenous inhibitor of DNA gyrase (YacG/DUF329 family)